MVEPEVTNTVSNFKVSEVTDILASGVVIKESFLQEYRNSKMVIDRILIVFIGFKNNSSILIFHYCPSPFMEKGKGRG